MGLERIEQKLSSEEQLARAVSELVASGAPEDVERRRGANEEEVEHDTGDPYALLMEHGVDVGEQRFEVAGSPATTAAYSVSQRTVFHGERGRAPCAAKAAGGLAGAVLMALAICLMAPVLLDGMPTRAPTWQPTTASPPSLRTPAGPALVMAPAAKAEPPAPEANVTTAPPEAEDEAAEVAPVANQTANVSIVAIVPSTNSTSAGPASLEAATAPAEAEAEAVPSEVAAEESALAPGTNGSVSTTARSSYRQVQNVSNPAPGAAVGLVEA